MRKPAIVLSALGLALLPALARADGDSCREVCNSTVACRTSCTECLYYTIDQGCGATISTTCGRMGRACDGRIGYGQAGNIFDGEFCDGLVPHNVDPTPPFYPQAGDGGFSCWYNSPDVICYEVPPLYGYINVRHSVFSNGHCVTNYGCPFNAVTDPCIIE